MSKFKISFKYRFEAAHRFTKSCAETCATPHGHTWYAKAIFDADAGALGPEDMVVEFSELKRAWKSFIQNTVDHSFMHHYEDPILPALRAAIPMFRGLPFPGDPTTELIAALFYAKLDTLTQQQTAQQTANRLAPTAVLIRETPTNSILFKRGKNTELIEKINQRFDGWWSSPDPQARNLLKR